MRTEEHSAVLKGRAAAGCSMGVLCSQGCDPAVLLHGIDGSSFTVENGRQADLVQEGARGASWQRGDAAAAALCLGSSRPVQEQGCPVGPGTCC